MGKVFLSVIALVILAVVAVIGYFAFTDIPPPAGTIEHAIPESKLPK
jgi:hypothetical protein